MPHMNSSSDDLAFTDEVKVYKDEGDEDEQEKSSENLKEDKVGLVNEGEEKTPLEFDLYNKQYASSMFKVPFTTDPRFANYFMSNYPAYMNGGSNQSSFMGSKMPLISSSVPNPFNFMPFPIHDPFAQNLNNSRYQLPDPKRSYYFAAAAAAAHFYSLPSTSQLHDAWSCDALSPQSSLMGSHPLDISCSSKTPSSNSNRISFSVSSIADSDKSPSSRLLTDPRSVSDFSSNGSVMPTGMPLSPSMFAAAAVAAAQAAAFNSSNSNTDVSSLHKAAAAHLRFLSSLHYQKQHSPASNGLSMGSCYSNAGLVPSRSTSNQGKYPHNYTPSMHQKSTTDERKAYAESLGPDRYHQSSDPLRHVSAFPGDNSDIESRKTIYSSRNSIDQRGSITSPDSPKKPHIKKPLNAFMLFMKEMRPKVQEECTLKESAAINQILGKKWHELSREDQTKYYELARKEKELHQQLYPGWSARDNYAAHAKRRKKRKLLNSSMLNSRDNFLSMNMMSMGHYPTSNSVYGTGEQHPCDMRTNRANLENGVRNNSIDMMMCVDTNRRHNGTSIQSMHGPGPAANGSNPKKCRARFGLEHQNLWCKPCRRKKKCVRFIYNTTDDSLVELVQTSNPESGKQETRMRHRVDNPYLNKSPINHDSRHMSPSGVDKTEDLNPYDVDKDNSFRSFSLLNIEKKNQQINYGNYTKSAIDHSPKNSRKRHLSTSSTEHDNCVTASPNSHHKDSKLNNRSVSNHSIEYHLNSKFSSSQSTSSNTTNTNTQLSSEMMGYDMSSNNSNAFALDKVLSNDYVSKTSQNNGDSDPPKLVKWEPTIGNPQSITTISTPPTPAVYSEFDYPSMSQINTDNSSRNQSPVTDKENERREHKHRHRLRGESTDKSPRLHHMRKMKEDEYEFREPSDSSPHSSESISSEPIRLSSLTPLVK